MSDTEILVIVFLCILLPVLMFVVIVWVACYRIQNAEQQEEKPIPSKTSCCKLHKQFCDVDIILSRYENASIQDIDCFNYDLFEMEMRFVFDTPDEKEAFFKKYPSMKKRYRYLEYFLWRVSSHK